MKKTLSMLLLIVTMSYGQAQKIDPSNLQDVKPPQLPIAMKHQYENWCLKATTVQIKQGESTYIPLYLPSADSVKGMLKSGMFPMTAKELAESGWTAAEIKAVNKDTLWDITVSYSDDTYYEYQTVWHSATKLNDVIVRFGRFHKTEYGAQATEEWAYYLAKGVSKKNILHEAVSAIINNLPPPVCKKE